MHGELNFREMSVIYEPASAGEKHFKIYSKISLTSTYENPSLLGKDDAESRAHGLWSLLVYLPD